MVNSWVEEWLGVNPNELTDVEVEPDVFYDYFMSIPTVKFQRRFREYKCRFIAKIRDDDANKIAQDLGIPNNQELIDDLNDMKKQYQIWQEEKWKWEEAKVNRPFKAGETDEEKKWKKAVRDREKGLTLIIKEHFKDKV
jgi:hypothetical protein